MILVIKHKEAQVDLGLVMENKLVNSYIPAHAPWNLKWYERDGLLTYIDQLKYNEFIKNPDNHFQRARINNFDLIHKEYRGEPIADNLIIYIYIYITRLILIIL